MDTEVIIINPQHLLYIMLEHCIKSCGIERNGIINGSINKKKTLRISFD